MVFDIKKEIHSSNQNEHVDEEENSDDDGATTYLDHPPPESRPYVCPVCGKRYVQKYFLIVHMDIHNYECSICKEKFWLQSDLFKHMNTRCGRDVSTVHEIPPHQRNPNAKQSGSTARKKKVGDSKGDKKDDEKDCARHGKSIIVTSKSSPNIRRESETYSCPECYREFSQNGNLTKHLRIHSGKKPFECGVCRKAFSQRSDLTSHLRIHTGEKPFECGVCSKAFRHKHHLTRHLRIHNGEKPFECGVCKKAFSQSINLTRHLRIHNGDKPFACDICKKTFRRKGQIRSHMNIHIPNGKRIYQCKGVQKSVPPTTGNFRLFRPFEIYD